MKKSGTIPLLAKVLWLTILGLLSAVTVHGQATVSVLDNTGWTPWTLGSGSVVMSDVAADQQTGQGQDDFVGDATTYALQQNAGLLGGQDFMLIRARFDKYQAEDQWGNGGNFGIGMDVDGNGSVDLIMMFTEGSGNVKNRSRTITFGLPGSDTNTSPSTTSWTFPTQTAINLIVDQTYNYTQATSGTDFGANPDAWLTFGISFNNLQTAIQTYAKEATPGQFDNFAMDYNTRISFIAFTSTQNNALNQDLGGVTGNTSSSLTWAELGSISAPMAPSGFVPEPATYGQVGALLLIGAGLMYRRHRRSRVLAPVAADPAA